MKLLIVAVLLVVVAAAIVRSMEAKLIFFPMREMAGTPQDIGLHDYEEVMFQAADRTRLHGWWMPLAGSRWTFLFLHGNAGNISHRLEKLRIMHALGIQVFIIDYRGYGTSQGRPSEAGVYQDAEAAYRYLVGYRKIPDTNIVLYGESLGGAVATELAMRARPAALITEDTFTSVSAMAKLTMPWMPSVFLATRFNTQSKMTRLELPKLIIHSVNDEIVPFAMGEQLYAAAHPPKTLLKLRGGHNTTFLDAGSLYTNGIRAFLETL